MDAASIKLGNLSGAKYCIAEGSNLILDLKGSANSILSLGQSSREIRNKEKKNKPNMDQPVTFSDNKCNICTVWLKSLSASELSRVSHIVFPDAGRTG